MLRDLARYSHLPWLICGDFNDLLYQEKMGGEAYLKWLLVGFNDAIEKRGLVEVQMVEAFFTWRRGSILEELDRGFANAQ